MTGSSLNTYTYSKLVNYFIAPCAVIIIPVKYVGKIKNFLPQYTNFCSTEFPEHVDTNLSCPSFDPALSRATCISRNLS